MENKTEEFENNEDLNVEELQMLEERWEKYIANPSSAISLEDFKNELKGKIFPPFSYKN